MFHKIKKIYKMLFEKGHLYHIYNQGNNRQNIFFCRDNFEFFLKKISIHILPYADILAWCLMQNHFHLMVYYKGDATHGVTQSHPVSEEKPVRSFNDSIGIMLRSYTRAINKQEHRSGALFREETKAICLTKHDDRIKNWYKTDGIISFSEALSENQYPDVCYNYILNNPVKHGLVLNPWEWEYSSYIDIIGYRDMRLINTPRINEFGLRFYNVEDDPKLPRK
jgi:putative transposase